MMEKNAEDVTVLGENYNNAAIYALLGGFKKNEVEANPKWLSDVLFMPEHVSGKC